MAFKYLDNIQVGGNIDLSKFEKKTSKLNPEKLQQRCQHLIEEKIKHYNDLVGREWLNNEGMIKMSEHPGYELSDSELVDSQEQGFAAQSKQSVSEWKDKKELNPANLTELALTVMLQRVLPSQFLVVRASAYDDYNNGVDQLIIDRETGNVICGIDEVINRDYQSGPSKKELKIRTKMEKGGFQVKYGAKFDQGNLSLASLKNIPAFYLSLDKAELVKLSENLEDENTSESEKELFKKLKASLLAQVNSYAKLSLNRDLLSNINSFKAFLEALN